MQPTSQITESLISSVVHHFYAKVRTDPMLSPIFAEKIGDNWDVHLARMVDFWSSIMLRTGRYSGRPHALHQPLPIDQSHFAHWLALFDETVKALCSPNDAALFLDRAENIAAALQAGMGLFPYAKSPNKRDVK